MAIQTGIGTPLHRLDGVMKTTGAALYAGEYHVDGLLYGVAVSAAIARGRIAAIDSVQARGMPGVVEIITHENRPAIPWFDMKPGEDAAISKPPFKVLCDDAIVFGGQPVALVVARTFEEARAAALLVGVRYEAAAHNTDLDAALPEKFAPPKKGPQDKRRGDPAAAIAQSAARIHEQYHLAMEHHNPMEMHATTVVRHDDGKLTVYDKNQGSQNVRDCLASAFGLAPGDIRVMNPFVGGAFGSGLRPGYQAYLAMLAATLLKRSVRVTFSRQQMFTHVHRPACIQDITLAADGDGRLSAIEVRATTSSSRFENYTENIVAWGATAYACDNTELDYTIAPIDTPTPGSMRAPGAATAMNLFEIAMDELAYACNADPLAFRLLNYSEQDGLRGKPYTSKALRAAYSAGAERFGWRRRTQAPRSMSEGRELIGWGMATGIWEALMMKATARATLDADGVLHIASAASDIGTGTYTIMAQIAAGALGLPIERIRVELGDSDLPDAPIEGGSAMAASIGSAVQLACAALADKLFAAASAAQPSPLLGAQRDQVEFAAGGVRAKQDPARFVPYEQIVAMSGGQAIQAEATAQPDPQSQEEKSRNTHSAVFAEVKIDEELGVLRVTRVVVAVAAGRIINPATARSQILGGVVWGMGMALQEEAIFDHRLGRIMNHNLAEYHIPVNADVHDIEVIFVDEADSEINPLGVKGVGEIGIVGTAAAIANAIFHATGKRLRSLPITIDHLL